MARIRPRKGTEKGREAGSIPVSLPAGQRTSSVNRSISHTDMSSQQNDDSFWARQRGIGRGVPVPRVSAPSELVPLEAATPVNDDSDGLRQPGVAASRVSAHAQSGPYSKIPVRRKSTTRKRLLGAASFLASIVAVFFLVTGVTYGRFISTTATQNNTFSSGTVTVSGSASQTCSVSNMAPGDSSSGYKPSGTLVGTGTDAECKITVSYPGSVPAYLGLDLGVSSTAGTVSSPAPGLFDGSSTGLQLLLKDSQGSPITYVNGTSYTNKSGSPVTMSFNSGVADLLVNTSPLTSSSSAVTFTLDFYLPTTSTTGYQGAASTFTITVHAVQSGNNAATGCTTGQQCPVVSGGFQWN